jgi:hypothetical protein
MEGKNAFTALFLAVLALLPATVHAGPHMAYAGFAQPVASYMLDKTSVTLSTATESKTLSVSVSDYAVYRYAYVSMDGQAWKQVQLSGNSLGGMWLNGSVTGQLSLTAGNFSLSQSRLSTARNFVVVYTCSRNGDAWDCHDGWQIWNFSARLDDGQGDVKIVSVSASSYQAASSYTPEKTIDGNLSAESRWSADGDGQWVMYGLSEEAYVDEMRIAFYKGNVRTTTFSVELSADGSSWSRALDHAVSGGNDLGYETFTFPGGQARYVRIVGHGNSDPASAGWTSITEAGIEDFGIQLACVPESSSATCAKGCGQQTGNCGQVVSCGACPTCTDGIMNGGETGVDCGGSCGTCNASIYDIRFHQDFEDDTLGNYNLNELFADFETTYTPDAYYSNLITIEMKNGSKTLKSIYPVNQYGTQGNGGTGTIFESYPSGMVGETDLYLSYNVYFEEGFDFNLGGKLNGLMGRPIPHSGTNITDTQAFRAHTTWNRNGDMIFYVYHHDNPTIYGQSNGLFGIRLPRGEWTSITMRLSLSDIGVRNGFVEAYINGKMVKQWYGLNFRNYDYDIDILYIETFMGGNDITWAPNHTQNMWMDDIYVYKYRPGTPGVAPARVMNAINSTIPVPNWPKA